MGDGISINRMEGSKKKKPTFSDSTNKALPSTLFYFILLRKND
jgi:hypothetical protein